MIFKYIIIIIATFVPMKKNILRLVISLVLTIRPTALMCVVFLLCCTEGHSQTLKELFSDRFLTTSNWIYGTGSASATLGTDVFVTKIITASTSTAVTNSVMLVQDYQPFATPSAPLSIHSVPGLNVATTSGTLVYLSMDLTVSPALITPTASSNLALFQTATASSIQSGSTNVAGNAMDGVTNFSSKWTSSNEDPSWIEVDLGTTATVNKVMLYWEPGCNGINFTIDVSTDGSTWSTASTITGNSISGQAQTYSFTQVPARYVRMYGTSHPTTAGANWGYSLYEFQVYGTSSGMVMVPSGYPTVRLGLFDAMVSAYDSAYNSVSVKLDPGKSTQNVTVMASSSSGPLRTVATFSTIASNIIGMHTYGLLLDYTASTTAPTVRIYDDGALLGTTTLSGSEGIMLGGSGSSQGTALRILAEATSTATSGANLQFDNITVGAYNTANVTLNAPSAVGPVLWSGVSRRAHGGYSNFDTAINTASGVIAPTINTVECRSGNVANIVLTFDKAISSATAIVSTGTATIGTPAYSTTAPYTVTIPLTGVTNAQKVTLKLTNITSADGGVMASAYAGFSYLVGDVNGNGTVDTPDALLVRNSTGINGSSGSFNPRADVNGNGTVDTPDALLVRNNNGITLP